MKAMILAAGQGHRFRPYTETLPKPALPFCGYPLLYYSLFQLRALSISKLILNTFHLPDEIIKLTKEIPTCLANSILISNEKDFGKLLGSGGGIKNAQDLLQGEGPFLVLNGDEVILASNLNFMNDFTDLFYSKKPIACLLTTKHPEAGKKFGAIWVDRENRVLGFGRTPPENIPDLAPLHFLGTQIYDEKIFSYLESGEESNILYDVLTLAIAKGESVLSFSIDCHWYETGNLTDFLNATLQVLDLIAKKHEYLTQFLNMLGNEYILTEKDSSLLLIHKSAQISQDAEISGILVAGANSIVERGAKVQNVILNSNVKVDSIANLNNTLCL